MEFERQAIGSAIPEILSLPDTAASRTELGTTRARDNIYGVPRVSPQHCFQESSADFSLLGGIFPSYSVKDYLSTSDEILTEEFPMKGEEV